MKVVQISEAQTITIQLSRAELKELSEAASNYYEYLADCTAPTFARKTLGPLIEALDEAEGQFT